MTPRLFLFFVLSSLLGASAAAQLAQRGQPASARQPQLLSADVPTYVLPRPDIDGLLAEDAARNNWPFRYGAVIPCTLGCDDSGRWDELPTGELVWRLRLASPGARSLGVLFQEYELPVGGRLFLQDSARTRVLGAFTSETRQPNGMLAVEPVLGDELWIEYVQDAGVNARPRLRLGEVVHDYRGILDVVRVRSPQQLLSGCLIDVNCPDGASYQDIKRSVIMVIAGGTLCSAGLLNTTANDATPYFLTANHCGVMTNVVAIFGYENTSCGSGGASQSNTISGATILAASAHFDSQLYRLSSTPPQSFAPFFAGWDRNVAALGPAISISHPSGLPKKIAIDNEAPENVGLQWQVTWEQGTLEGGSSGSPLFSGAKRVLGPACCVNFFGCNGQSAFYGRFGRFYDQKNLGQWLDPIGSGSMGIDGCDPFQPKAIPYFGSGSNLNTYVSTTPPGVGTTWNAEIDTSLRPGTTSTWIICHASPSAGSFVAAGELLVDVTTPRLFTLFAPVVGGLSMHSNAIPNDPLLVGQVAYTQAVLFGGVKTLTNGIELRLR